MDEGSLQYYNDAESVIITGMITEDPEQADSSLSFKFAADSVEISHEIRKVSGLALVRTNMFTKYKYGDVLKISGKLATPQDRGSFDYKGYLASRETYSIMNYPQIELLERGGGSKILSWIFTCRNALSGTINAALPEPQASLAQGIFLGKTGTIPAQLRDSFARTGTSHILAISGMNLTIIIGILLSLGGRALGKRWGAYVWLSLLIIWFYTVFSGLKPPVIRAAGMGSMFLLAELLGRQKTAITAITFTAAVMIGISPAILGDAGFQLSFLSMCGLIFIHPRLRHIFIQDNAARATFNFLRKAAYAIFDAFLVTLSALLATLPVLAFHFGIISILGLPATVFILPALPGIILLTAIMSMAGLFLPPLASAIGWLDWLAISYYIMIVKVFSLLPLASAEVGRIDFWQIAVYYMLLAVSLCSIDHRQNILNSVSMLISKAKVFLGAACSRLVKLPLHWILLALLILNSLAWIAVINLPDGKLHVTFLDIGQGDSVLVQTPDGRNILIDAGPSPSSLKLQLGKALPFWDKNIAMLILTQFSSDHVSGLSGITGNYNIGQCLHSAEIPDSQAYSMLLHTMEDCNIPHDVISYPQEIWLDASTRLQVLHPHKRCGRL